MNRMGFTRKHLIYGAITFVSLLGAILKVTVLNDPSKRLLTLYCLALYVVFLFWAIGQLRADTALDFGGKCRDDTLERFGASG